MRYNLYTVYDRVGEEAGAPFICRTDGIAVRQFVTAFRQANRPEIKLEDHWLYRIGSFDNETMVLKTFDVPLRLELGNFDVEVANEQEAVQ